MRVEGDRVYFSGREDGVVNVGGVKLQLETIEHIVLEHPGVAACTIVPKRSSMMGALLAFEIVPKDAAVDRAVFVAELKQWCRARLQREAQPASIRLLDEIRSTAAGKTCAWSRGMKSVVVTGVSRGLGLAIAARLASEGFRVIGLSRTRTPAFEDVLAKHPGLVEFETFDVADINSIPERARAIIKREGNIYGLVNNAGVGLDGVLATMHQKDIERVIRTNLTGPIALTKFMMRPMLSKGEGRIINISSIIASTGFHGLSVYAATKAGLEGFTRSLSREAGKRNVTVNCVAPGYMETEMTAGLQGEKLKSVRRRAPLGLPRPEQVAAAVSYLLQPDACTVTGTILTVDGGSTA